MLCSLQQLKERLESAPATPPEQQPQSDVSPRVERLEQAAKATLQQAGFNAQSARKLREKNVLLRKFKQHKDETPEKLKQSVGNLVAKRFATDATVVNVKRLPQKRKDAASPRVVIVELSSVADKRTLFKARSKLAGSDVVLDDDLTPFQQTQRSAAWPTWQAARANKQPARWEAENLFIKEGEDGWRTVCAPSRKAGAS